MWPLKVFCISKKVIAVTNVTALTEPYAANGARVVNAKMFFKNKKLYGIMIAIKTPNATDQMISSVK
jgi:hypothetical protein